MDKLQQIKADFESDLDRATAAASLRFNMYLRTRLEEWSARFPRHAFKVWEGHGRMSIDVSPAVMGQTSLDFMHAEHYRGAVAELVAEAVALVDFYNDSETKVCLFVEEHATEGYA